MEKSESREIQQEQIDSTKFENKNAEIEKERRTSSGDEKLLNEVRTMFQKLESLSSTAECRIYRVPYNLRKVNEEAYTPQVISIGPIHHNDPRFQTMEKHKVRYLRSFIERKEIKTKLENLVGTIREMEDRIRHCYVATILPESDDFVKMIMLDASFILELFFKIAGGGLPRDDPLSVEACLYCVVWQDLLLLENQLPFFVLEELYDLACPDYSKFVPLIYLTFSFFNSLNIHDVSSVNVKIQHFTDLLGTFQDRLGTFQLPYREPPVCKRRKKDGFLKYSATQLHVAGVKFKKDSSKYLGDLNFKGGVLKIPVLEFDDNTEVLVRNIMALEQRDDRRAAFITDFYLIMDGLINTTKDVDLLIGKGIIVNFLGDNSAVKSLINNLNKEIFRIGVSNYTGLCDDLNDFYEEPWHRWKVILRDQYFSIPWRTAFTIAFIILLVLMLAQAVYFIIK